MTTDKSNPGLGATNAGSSDERAEEVAALYADRLIAGEKIDAEEILQAHPSVGREVLDQLAVFVDLALPDDNAPLGTLGDYTLRRQIGRGGMGVVYEAWQGSLDRQVALKVLPAGIAADTKATNRFLREAQVAAKLSHPQVVSVYGFGVEQNTPYYSMELVEGDTLAQILARTKDAEPETDTAFGKKDNIRYFGELAAAFADVADGLQHAHSKGVTHRDIKPSNLILDSDGRLRILDFGLARLEGQESLTLSGDVMGTPLYMSPEQARRKKIPIDHRTDIYSLGATMYEAACGRPPFRGKDHADTLSQIIERDPVELRKINQRVPKDLETIVLKCLRKDSGDRYGTAEALGQDLRRFVRGDAIEARGERTFQRWSRRACRHRRSVAAGVLVLVALVAAVWTTSHILRRPPAPRVETQEIAVEDLVTRYGKVESEFTLPTPVSLDTVCAVIVEGLALEIRRTAARGVDTIRSDLELLAGSTSLVKDKAIATTWVPTEPDTHLVIKHEVVQIHEGGAARGVADTLRLHLHAFAQRKEAVLESVRLGTRGDDSSLRIHFVYGTLDEGAVHQTRELEVGKMVTSQDVGEVVGPRIEVRPPVATRSLRLVVQSRPDFVHCVLSDLESGFRLFFDDGSSVDTLPRNGARAAKRTATSGWSGWVLSVDSDDSRFDSRTIVGWQPVLRVWRFGKRARVLYSSVKLFFFYGAS